MEKVYLFLLLLLCSVSVMSQDLTQVAFQSSTYDRPTAMAQLVDGRYATSAFMNRTWETSSIVVLNADGTVAWTKTIQAYEVTYVKCILPLSDGGFLAGGQIVGCDFNTDWGFLIRYDAEGNEIWNIVNNDALLILNDIAGIAFAEDENSVWCAGRNTSMTKVAVADGAIVEVVQTPVEIRNILRVDAENFILTGPYGVFSFDGQGTFNQVLSGYWQQELITTVAMPNSNKFATLRSDKAIIMHTETDSLNTSYLNFFGKAMTQVSNGFAVVGSNSEDGYGNGVVAMYDENLFAMGSFDLPEYFFDIAVMKYYDGDLMLLCGEKHGPDESFWEIGYSQNLVLQAFDIGGGYAISDADAAVTSVSIISEPILTGNYLIENITLAVTVKNLGVDKLKEAWVNVQYDGLYFDWICAVYAHDAFHFTDLDLDTGEDTIINVSQTLPIKFLNNGTFSLDICAWTSAPNNLPDIQPSNDYACTALVDVDDVSRAVKIEIVPNPTDGEFKVIGSKAGVLHIKTAQGQIIASQNYDSQNIITSSLPSGMYFVDIQTVEGNRVVLKLIKN